MPARKSKRKPSNRRRSADKFAAPPPAGGEFEKLVALMGRLRAPNGCPWDREQTHATLRTYLIEEAYEVLDALDSTDDAKFAEELGDLLLQVLFHAQIAHEEGRFDINDVMREIYEKMIRRHPHVFGEKQAKDAAEVLRNWERIKAEERKGKMKEGGPAKEPAEAPSVLEGVPRTLPALLEANQLTRKAARIGFDWESVDGIFEKLEEEVHELREVLAARPADASRVEGEVGDILFVAVNLARFLDIDPEIALKKTSAKFSRRFRQMERVARDQGTTIAQVPRSKMETLWEQAKQRENTLKASKVAR
ncbi:MAG: nucleoside triphosphate pyrophosphohydrolase [Candidatus Acidiferrum sp.]